jgi:uncharacterized membrane-anchored protein
MLEEILIKEKEIATRIERAHADAQEKIAAARRAIVAEKESHEKKLKTLHANAVEQARSDAEQEAHTHIAQAIQETKKPILSQEDAVALAHKIVSDTHTIT